MSSHFLPQNYFFFLPFSLANDACFLFQAYIQLSLPLGCRDDSFHPSESGRCPAGGAEVKAEEEEEAGEGEKQQ